MEEQVKIEDKTSYQVKLNGFEGPFDLLLHLIEEQKLDIYEISIAQITEQYIAYLNTLEKKDVNISSEFLIMAAALLEMKSKMLLPQGEIQDEALLKEIEEERKLLLDKLIEYKKYKNLSKELEDYGKSFQKIYTKEKLSSTLIDDIYDRKKVITLKEVNLEDLVKAFQDIWQRLEKEEEPGEIYDENINVQDKIDSILYFLKTKSKEVEFEQLFNIKSTRLEVIVTFLALLELVRLKKIAVQQKDFFGKITIKGR